MIVGQKHREVLIRNMVETLERRSRERKMILQILGNKDHEEDRSMEEGSKVEAKYHFEKMRWRTKKAFNLIEVTEGVVGWLFNNESFGSFKFYSKYPPLEPPEQLQFQYHRLYHLARVLQLCEEQIVGCTQTDLRRALPNQEALALMSQANVRKRKCGLFTELNKIQNQVIRDKAYLLQQQGCLVFWQKVPPKTEHLIPGMFFCFMPCLVIILQVMRPRGI
ncbi:hypothetical protein L195_g020630 [Trifolium pratense]|uniref:Uncharacterized protein n=1 Tax=Trifolium pratense TaxID=57577 RepID=A0A2K3N2W9_TRIPR|nr:hypothetical protein L195_g020630 [Trifolium pratense]